MDGGLESDGPSMTENGLGKGCSGGLKGSSWAVIEVWT